jgi:hypothetical protein
VEKKKSAYHPQLGMSKINKISEDILPTEDWLRMLDVPKVILAPLVKAINPILLFFTLVFFNNLYSFVLSITGLISNVDLDQSSLVRPSNYAYLIWSFIYLVTSILSTISLVQPSPYVRSLSKFYYSYSLFILGQILWCIFYILDLHVVCTFLLFHVAFFSQNITRVFLSPSGLTCKHKIKDPVTFLDYCVWLLFHLSLSSLAAWSFAMSFVQLRQLMRDHITMSDLEYQFLSILLVSLNSLRHSTHALDLGHPLFTLWWVLSLQDTSLTNGSSLFFILLFLSFSLVISVIRVLRHLV